MTVPDFDRIGRQLEAAPPLEMMLTAPRAFVLIAQLQVALRHPDNIGASADIARDMARRLQDWLAQVCPEAAETLEQGWHPEFDVSREEFEALQQQGGDR